MNDREKAEKELKNTIFSKVHSDFKKCLWYTNDCKNPVIKAHSIQNSKILEKLAVNGKLIRLAYELNLESGPIPKFEDVGINKATTFTGLCSYHDELIFRDIEKKDINVDEPYHLILLAYRALLREFHSSLSLANHLQDIYEKSNELKLPQEWNEELLMMLPTMYILQSYLTYRYKHHFDKILTKSSFDQISNILISFPQNKTTIAVNSMFSPIDNFIKKEDKEEPKFIMLNVFPLDSQCYILFSFRTEHKDIVNEFLSPILQAKGKHQLYLISKLILQNCENFVINPEYFDSFSEGKKNAIIEYFFKNLHGNKIDYDDKELYLF